MNNAYFGIEHTCDLFWTQSFHVLVNSVVCYLACFCMWVCVHKRSNSTVSVNTGKADQPIANTGEPVSTTKTERWPPSKMSSRIKGSIYENNYIGRPGGWDLISYLIRGIWATQEGTELRVVRIDNCICINILSAIATIISWAAYFLKYIENCFSFIFKLKWNLQWPRDDSFRENRFRIGRNSQISIDENIKFKIYVVLTKK